MPLRFETGNSDPRPLYAVDLDSSPVVNRARFLRSINSFSRSVGAYYRCWLQIDRPVDPGKDSETVRTKDSEALPNWSGLVPSLVEPFADLEHIENTTDLDFSSKV